MSRSDWRNPDAWDDRLDNSNVLPMLDNSGYESEEEPGPAKEAGDDPLWQFAEPSLQLGPGTVLRDRFVLEELLGTGGMSVVFKARDMRREEAQDREAHVAIKILNDQFRSHPESLLALQRETRKSQNLAHPNIIRVFDFDRDGTRVFMVMELLVGSSVERMIRSQVKTNMAEAWPIIRQIGLALDYAHSHRVVHADVKPSNVFITTAGVVKVFDFSIASAMRVRNDERAEATVFDPHQLGALTPAYASYERFSGAAPEPSDDIYGFALVIYELLTGFHPYQRMNALDVMNRGLVANRIPALSARQWRALSSALSVQRHRRPHSVSEFLEDLRPRPWYLRW
jgi:serine/threonine protein kinase